MNEQYGQGVIEDYVENFKKFWEDYADIILMDALDGEEIPLTQAIIQAQEMGTGIISVDNEGSCTHVDYADLLEGMENLQEKEILCIDSLPEVQEKFIPEPTQEERFDYQTPAQRCGYSTKIK